MSLAAVINDFYSILSDYKIQRTTRSWWKTSIV